MTKHRITMKMLIWSHFRYQSVPLWSGHEWHLMLSDRPFQGLLLKVLGDTNTPLYLSGHREIPTLPLLCGGRPLYQRPSKEIPTLILSHKSTALPLIQQRDWHLFSVSLTAWTCNTYSAVVWHCTQRIPSPVTETNTLKGCTVLFIQIAMNYSSASRLQRFTRAAKEPLS